MAEVLGLGLTHYPPLAARDEHMANILRWTLKDPGIPEELREPTGWPAEMQQEWDDDGGTKAAAQHRESLLGGFARCREELDEFAPDVVLVWGDDQYENFREEIIPPFCVMAYDDFDLQPHLHQRSPNVWDEPVDMTVRVAGRADIGKTLVAGLLDADFDVAYSYQPRENEPFPHAFANTVMYLDYHRKGFPYPILPVSVNCYGRSVVSRRGALARFAEIDEIAKKGSFDPPGPTPKRCFQFGAAIARVMAASPWRVALVASSSWSHAFLNDKDWHLFPAMESDRQLYRALKAADYDFWKNLPSAKIEEDGQHELLNWFCLVGAMAELGRKPVWTTFIETHVMNSNKCFAIFD